MGKGNKDSPDFAKVNEQTYLSSASLSFIDLAGTEKIIPITNELRSYYLDDSVDFTEDSLSPLRYS